VGLSSVSELEGKQVGTVDGYLWVKELQQVLGATCACTSTVDMNQDLKAAGSRWCGQLRSALHNFQGTP